MKIFLDSNILFEDYFFENKSQKNILDYAKKGLINLYMSEIVKLELRRQFKKEIELKNRELAKIIKNAKRLKIDEDIKVIDVNSQLEKFDEFYTELESHNEKFEILKYNNEFLPDIVDRAIYRKKPFTEEKTELKDALIWKTYANFVEHESLENCILLTNNTSDFCDKKDKTKIHSELLKDTERFYVINSAFNFLKDKSKIIESPEYEFSTYIKTIIFNESFVSDLIKSNFSEQIKEVIDKKIESINPFDIVDLEYWNDGYVTGFEKEILECLDVEFEIIADKSLVSGKVLVLCETESYEYNSLRERGEDTFSFLSEQDITFQLYFNFDMKKGEECSELEITDIEII